MEERKEAGLGGGRNGTVIQKQASADYTQSPEDEMALQSPHHYGEREGSIPLYCSH